MNKYEIIGCVGEGAYGIVLKCRDRWNGKFRSCTYSLFPGNLVAIKKFKARDDDDKFARTALREVKILRMLRHINIVEMHDALKR